MIDTQSNSLDCERQRVQLSFERRQVILANLARWAQGNEWARSTAAIKTRELQSGFAEVQYAEVPA